MSIWIQPKASNEFEIEKIISHTTTKNGIKYLVKWKDSYYKTIDDILPYKTDIKNMVYNKQNKLYLVRWKNTFMSFEELRKNCDIILGAYILCDMKQGN